MKKLYVLASIIMVVAYACTYDSLGTPEDVELRKVISSRSKTGLSEYFILPASNDYANIPQSPVNPLTAIKVELGKLLFFESCFSVEAKHPSGLATFSCSSCHVPAAGFRPNRIQGIADGGFGFGVLGEQRSKLPEYDDQDIDAQGARPLSVLNVAFVTNTMWNGSFGDAGVNTNTDNLWGFYDPATAINSERLGALEGQNIEGLKTHRMLFNEQLVRATGYTALFDAAFPDVPVAERYTRKTASFALSAYLRTLLSTEAPFQKWLKGEEDAMDEEQKRGALLFFDKAGCYRCHREPNLGSVTFQGLGVEDLFENGGLKTSLADRRNLGRGGFTGLEEDMFRFRVPQLYNIGDSGPYFHGSSKKNLHDVVAYFNAGVPENPRVPASQISPYFHPLQLTSTEMRDLETFLREGLHDPSLQRYVPESVISGNCFPNNDPVSIYDLGCY